MLPMRLYTSKGDCFLFCSRYETRLADAHPQLVFNSFEAIYHFIRQFDNHYSRSWCWREMLMKFDSNVCRVDLLEDQFVVDRIAEMIADRTIVCFRQEPKKLAFAGEMTPDQTARLEEKQAREERARAREENAVATILPNEESTGQIEVELIDSDGNQVTGMPYVLYGPQGMATQSRSQQNDNIRHAQLIPGLYQVTLGKLEKPWQHLNAPQDDAGPDSTITLTTGGSLWATSFETGIPMEELWAYAENDTLKQSRDDPNQLQSRDAIAIPRQILNFDAQLGDRKTFQIRRHLLHIRVRLMEHDEPRPDLNCALTVAGTPYLLTSDADGRLNFDNLKISSLGELEQIRLFVEPKPIIEGGETPPTEVYHLNVGSLNPLKGLNGGLQRIWNLGLLPKNSNFPIGLERDFENLTDNPDSGNGWACVQRWREKDINTLPTITGEPQTADFTDLDTATVKAESQLPAPANNTPKTPEKSWYPPQDKLPETDIFASPGTEVTIHRRVRLRVDSHMHIQSNNCAPMPLQWRKVAPMNIRFGDFLKMSRTTSNFVSPAFTGDMGRIGKQNTGKIADIAIKDYDEAYRSQLAFPESPLQEILNLMMVMTMDMEYAHLEGYQGEMIYQYRDREWYRKIFHGALSITAPLNPLFPATDGTHYEKHTSHDDTTIIYLNKEEKKLFESWPVQLEHTKMAAIRHPLQLVPLYHFDPRRWIPRKSESVQTHEIGLKHPFQESISGDGFFIGFKMYTALGYRPLDEKLPHLKDFYDFCNTNGRPIMCHCTRGGMFTYDKEFYADYLGQNYCRLTQPSPNLPGARRHHRRHHPEDPVNEHEIEQLNREQAIRWYNENYINPNAWRPVLEKYSNLYLCLAHFTGSAASEYDDDDGWDVWLKACEKSSPQSWFDNHPDSAIRQMVELIQDYPNVHVDVSYMFVKEYEKPFRWLLEQYPILKDRILYGSDWFMLETDESLTKFAADVREIFDSFGDGLWERVSHTNPLRFWRYHEWVDKFVERLNSGVQDIVDGKKDEKRNGRGRDTNPRFQSSTTKPEQENKFIKEQEDDIKKRADAINKLAKIRQLQIQKAGVI